MMVNASVDTPAEFEQRIGRAVRQLRLDSGYGQEELAARANVSRIAVQSLEAGRGSRLVTLVRVLGALGRLDLLDTLRPRETVSPMEALAAQRRASRGAVEHPRVRRARG